MNVKYCPYCGAEIQAGMAFCPNCGANLEKVTLTETSPRPVTPPSVPTIVPAQPPAAPRPTVTVGTKSPGVAAILSFLLPGLGQIYDGRIGRGLLILFIVLPLSAVIAALFFWLLFPLILPFILWIWQIYDAYNIAKQYNAYLLQYGSPPW